MLLNKQASNDSHLEKGSVFGEVKSVHTQLTNIASVNYEFRNYK